MTNASQIEALSRLAVSSLGANVEFSENAIQCDPWKSNGFSDCEIFRLRTPHGNFSIRSWPNHADSRSKVRFWASVNASFAKTNGGWSTLGTATNLPFPAIHSWHLTDNSASSMLLMGEQLWTLSDWVDGQSMSSRFVDRSLVRHLASAIGRLHARTRVALDRDAAPLGRYLARSGSIMVRSNVLRMLDHRLFAAIDRSQLFAHENLSDKLKHCIATVFERRIDWDRFLSICAAQERECHWIVRDLWRENVLLDSENRFASIVDLGASRVDWPGLDFVRLFGSLQYEYRIGQDSIAIESKDKRDLWEEAYEAYTQENGIHSIASLDECRMLHLVSSGLSVLQWVVWVTDGTFDGASPEKLDRIALRIAELCDRFLVESV
jgi:hypothetical protein